MATLAKIRCGRLRNYSLLILLPTVVAIVAHGCHLSGKKRVAMRAVDAQDFGKRIIMPTLLDVTEQDHNHLVAKLPEQHHYHDMVLVIGRFARRPDSAPLTNDQATTKAYVLNKVNFRMSERIESPRPYLHFKSRTFEAVVQGDDGQWYEIVLYNSLPDWEVRPEDFATIVRSVVGSSGSPAN